MRTKLSVKLLNTGLKKQFKSKNPKEQIFCFIQVCNKNLAKRAKIFLEKKELHVLPFNRTTIRNNFTSNKNMLLKIK